MTDDEFKELGRKVSVKVGEVDENTMRLLTHLDVSEAQVEWAIKKIAFVCKELA